MQLLTVVILTADVLRTHDMFATAEFVMVNKIVLMLTNVLFIDLLQRAAMLALQALY